MYKYKHNYTYYYNILLKCQNVTIVNTQDKD